MKMRTCELLLVLFVTAALATGCGADYIGPTDLGADVADTAAGDTLDSDATNDTAVSDARVDVATDTNAPDSVIVDEVIAEDIVVEDTALPPFLEEREGWAWAVSPDDINPTKVVYPHLTALSGKLTGKFADVWNCLREDGGPVETMNWDGVDYDVQLCHYTQTVTPDPDGTYLSLTPPDSTRDGNDAFAEGHTYYSMNKVHDYFHDTFGYTDGDRSLFSVVNMSFQILGSPGWMGLDNAAYLPDASYGFMGFNMHDGEMLAFGQGRRIDYCTDASVIFHEYTHSVVGGNRFGLNTGDKYGFNADPPGLNEGFADYFASTILDMAVLGEYALGDQSRDLSEYKRCPDDYVGESHTDGRIWSSALWEIRVTLGAELADQIAYGTLAASGFVTTFGEAAQYMLDVTAELSPDNVGVVRGILENHNLISCSRVLEYGTELGGKGYYLPGTSDSYAYEFQTTVAGTFQYKIVVPPGSNGFIAYFRAEDMYGYDSAPEVKMMVKRGDEPINWTYAGRAISDAEKSFVADRMNSKDVAFSVTGSCAIPGVYHIQMINKASYSVVAKLNSVTFLTEQPEELTWDGCTWPDEGTGADEAVVEQPVVEEPVVEETPDVIEPDVVTTDAVGGDA